VEKKSNHPFSTYNTDSPIRSHGIGLGEAILGERLLELGEPDLRRIRAVKLQQPLHVVDNRIEGTVLVIRRATKLDAGRSLLRKLLCKFLHQP
jgi:hypothetical protein